MTAEHKISQIAEKSITIFTVFVSLFFFALFGILVLSLLFTSTNAKPYRLSSNNQKVIEKSLNSSNVHGQKKRVSDCVLEPTDYGWSCREIKSKKVFKIYNRK
jgi:hypothetical protein